MNKFRLRFLSVLVFTALLSILAYKEFSLLWQSHSTARTSGLSSQENIAPNSQPAVLLIIGDSMAWNCRWPDYQKFALPTRNLPAIESALKAALDNGQIKTEYKEVCVFAGTADASYPASWTYDDYLRMGRRFTASEIAEHINTEERLARLTDDFASLIELIMDRMKYDRLVIISPFPNRITSNFWLIRNADGRFAAKYGAVYLDVNDVFYDFDGEAQRDPRYFIDEYHLSELGYNRLRDALDSHTSAKPRNT